MNIKIVVAGFLSGCFLACAITDAQSYYPVDTYSTPSTGIGEASLGGPIYQSDSLRFQQPTQPVVGGGVVSQRPVGLGIVQPFGGVSESTAARAEIRAMPLLHRPNRPFHIYGNTVRRLYYRQR